MRRLSKLRKLEFLYLLIFIHSHSTLMKFLFLPWIQATEKSVPMYRILCMLAFVSVFAVTTEALSHGISVSKWRIHMKKNYCAWLILLMSFIAYVILMVEAYRYFTATQTAIRIIIAASFIFIPNLWALTLQIKRKKNK